MTAILVFNFVMNFILFRIFRFEKILFVNIFMNPAKTPAEGWLNVPTPLGHMLILSAQC